MKKTTCKEHVTKGNVFDDLRFSPEESENLKIRSEIMRAIDCYIKEKHLKQKQAAEAFGVSQPRINDLLKGKIHLFSIDTLINMIARVGLHAHIFIDDRMAA